MANYFMALNEGSSGLKVGKGMHSCWRMTWDNGAQKNGLMQTMQKWINVYRRQINTIEIIWKMSLDNLMLICTPILQKGLIFGKFIAMSTNFVCRTWKFKDYSDSQAEQTHTHKPFVL